MNKQLEDVVNNIKQRITENPELKAEKVFECIKCKDTGWISYKDEFGYEFQRKCDCWIIKESRRLIELSGISIGFQQKGLKNFKTNDIPQLVNAKNKAIKYLQNFERCEKTRYNSIMFCGQVGAGKTHLGIAICSNLMDRSIAVSYMAYRNTITKIKQKLTNESDYERELIKYIQTRVLYIDDLLKGKITESDVNILYEIVNYRYMNNLPLIISTEKSINELLDFDEAIASRIIEMCRGNIVQLLGEELNYRLNS